MFFRPYTDLSPKMVDSVTERIAARGLSDRIKTEQADAQLLTTMQVLS
jgi:cyclopropane fatty-acyl-phospholipid synthase-like methyltransferase